MTENFNVEEWIEKNCIETANSICTITAEEIRMPQGQEGVEKLIKFIKSFVHKAPEMY